MRPMRLLIALLLSLSLGAVAAPADAHGARAAAAPDPQVVATLEAAVVASYDTAWRRESGTVSTVCLNDLEGDTTEIIEYDARTGTKRTRTTWENDVPTDLIERGRTRYSRTVPAVRKSLKVHRAPRPPKWVKTRSRFAAESPAENLWGDDGYEPIISDANWDELTMTAHPEGGATFNGKLKYGHVEPIGTHIAMTLTAVTDPAGRLVRTDERYELVGPGGEVQRSSSCAMTWIWARPEITIPKKARANPHKVRYQWERKAVVDVMDLTWEAGRRLESGAPEAEVIAWLHTQVGAKQQRAQGIKLIQGKAKRGARPAIAFKITVAGGAASWKPVR